MRGTLKSSAVALLASAVMLLGAGAGAAIAKPSKPAKHKKAAPSLVVSRLSLDAYSATKLPHTPPVTTKTLAKGKLYVATVQGTISFYAAIDYLAIQAPFTQYCGTPQSAPQFPSAGGVGKVSNDAQFIFAQPITTGTCASVPLPKAWPNFQLDNGFGFGHPPLLSRTPVGRPNRSHTYSYAITGQGKPVSFELIDPDLRDDYGSFRIVVRKAVQSDCAGPQYKAFALKKRAVCLGDTARTKGTVPKVTVPKLQTLAQAPIGRVLRDSDVVNAVNLELPNGALTASQFASVDAPSAATASAEARALTGAGFASGAISAFNAANTPALKSTAIVVSSPAKTAAAYAAAVQLAVATQGPTGSTATSAPDPAIPNATLVTFTPAAGGVGGVEIVAQAGSTVYTLRALQAPDQVNRAQVEALLNAVIARG